MAADPFYSSKDVLEQKVSDLEQTVADYRRLQNPDAATAQWQADMIEMNYTEARDLMNVLNQACRKAAEDPARFGLTEGDVRSRQAFVDRMAQRLKMINQQMEQVTKPAKAAKAAALSREEKMRRAGQENNERFIHREMQHQQAMLQEQDLQLDEVDEQVGKIKLIAGAINNELRDAEKRERELDQNMDRTQTKLDDAVAKMKEFLKKKSTWLWIGCAVLTIILLVMIVWAFFI